jgi:hypothetical protein
MDRMDKKAEAIQGCRPSASKLHPLSYSRQTQSTIAEEAQQRSKRATHQTGVQQAAADSQSHKP